MSQEHDFDHAFFDQRLDFGDDFGARPAELAAAHVRHDAEAANFIAALHDRHKRFDAVDLRSPVGVFHISRIAVKGGFHRPGARGFDLLDHFRQLVNIVRAENQIEMRHPF